MKRLLTGLVLIASAVTLGGCESYIYGEAPSVRTAPKVSAKTQASKPAAAAKKAAAAQAVAVQAVAAEAVRTTVRSRTDASTATREATGRSNARSPWTRWKRPAAWRAARRNRDQGQVVVGV